VKKCYCTFENRPESQIGLKLLALSLERYCGDFTLCVGMMGPQPALSDWLRRHAPHAVEVPIPPVSDPAGIWQVKPGLILQLLAQGWDDVTWLDADLIVLRDLHSLLGPLDETTLLLAQELDYAFEFNRPVLEAYGLRPARELKGCVNTCAMRMTTCHEPLLRRMIACMESPFFKEQTDLPPARRTIKWHYDQTIMEMLLSTAGGDWTPDFPVQLIPDGSGVIQELGVSRYRLLDRLRNGLGLVHPWIVHCLGMKPWDPSPRTRRYRAVSVYSAFAEQYRDQVEEPMPWANADGWNSRAGRLLSLGQPHWMGLVHCLAGTIKRVLTRHKDPVAPGLRTPEQTAAS
jgi:hypothetical protein